ncbi:10522_t:CDS:2 [Paraglomus occultum]|uniref:10522_t:CDS:1 n=1 Tax=Paraglomus occultum TaxID=144539 RepID=A0A9N9ASS4_9GLOM|nr:10522_t:CDS:2 [Paraglomus occultum]
MNLTKVTHIAQKRVPLIKFLGPRRKLVQTVDPKPQLHPLAPKGATLPKNHQEQHIYLTSYDELPDKYRRTELASDEIEAIEACFSRIHLPEMALGRTSIIGLTYMLLLL